MTRNWTRIAIGFMCALVGLSSLSFAPQQAVADTKSSSSVADVRKQLDELEQQQQDLASQKAQSEEKLKAAQNQLGTTQAQIEAQKAQLSQLEAQLAQIALQQYQDRGLNTTAMLMTSDTSDDLLGHITAMQQVTDTANTLMTSLQLGQASLADLERSEQAAVATIEAEQANLTTLEADTRAKIDETSALLNKLTAVAAKTAAAKAGSGSASNSVGKGVSNPSTAVPSPSSSMTSPLASYTVSSPYGWRVHPITGVWTFHDGLDMSAACGKSVLAPANGFVIDYYWAGGYGNRLLVDNGMINGHHVVTTYNHLSAGVAKAGQEVTQGQVIASVGSTGASTGCHLHYMIWVDGEMVNPADYV